MLANNGPSVTPDPASSIPGLLWNQQRVNMTDAWKTTAGDPAVTVGVADTGLDYTHSELAPKVTAVVDFTTTEDPPICKTFLRPQQQVGRRVGRHLWRAREHRLERPRQLDRRQHRRRARRRRHQRDRAEGQPGGAEDLAVVRLGLRLGDPRRLPLRGRPRDQHREHLLRRLPGQEGPRPGAHPEAVRAGREVREQEGHDHRRRRRQRARPGQRQRQGRHPWSAHGARHGPGRLR